MTGFSTRVEQAFQARVKGCHIWMGALGPLSVREGHDFSRAGRDSNHEGFSPRSTFFTTAQLFLIGRINFVIKKEQTSPSDQTWVLSSLEHDQLVKAKKHPIPRRHLKGPELLVLWSLRLYLIFMMAVVTYQVWLAAR